MSRSNRGTGFNLFVEGDGHISTSGGKLHLNTSNAAPGTSAPDPDHKSDINAAVEALFPAEKKNKKGVAPASASPAPAAAKPAAPEVKQQAQSGKKAADPQAESSTADKKTTRSKPRPIHVQKFIDSNLEAAKKVKQDWGIPVSVTLAQSAQETGWGQHVKNNAWFGIKGKSTSGNSVSFRTSEVINGKRISITDSFRSYNDFAESADDYGRFLNTNPRYKSAFNFVDSPNDFIDKIAKAGYATDPNHAKSLKRIITSQNLTEFD
ncbi:hypothetical protein HC231_08150 [Brenneria izadpanahii]|uniref:Mannosyl-glycoprotein endo-beta-N-acetylglucosamidase-like domain-containing protein n=1 Tax=Brenneria izadpanahii TaxID=2722756 RepID=A0ABX7USN1_9GAMM|nr:glucosaminidase domain-containing protein [Brenneria izadpanahii]QTF07906.1 hypothetical protein HC231_08150 [Brenneria izadpanahii]